MAALLRREKTMMHAYSLSGPQAGQIAMRGRQLLRRRFLTPHQYALLDTVLWAARRPGSATLIASLQVLARLAGQARSTVAEGIRRLEELGLLQRIRRRVRVAWIGGGQASRQVANAYRLIVPDTESAARPAREQPSIISIIEATSEAQRAAREALAERRRQVEEAMKYRPRYRIAV
jgi:DNA-binding MarR family transcriptional regulator